MELKLRENTSDEVAIEILKAESRRLMWNDIRVGSAWISFFASCSAAYIFG